MLALRPEDRPTMRGALEKFREMRRNAMDSEDTAVQRNYLFDNMQHEQFAGVMQASLRGEDVEFVNRDLDAGKVAVSRPVL